MAAASCASERDAAHRRRRSSSRARSSVLIVTGEDGSLVIGVITGSAYGLVALGLVLIYKSSGVFNFAQGEFGTVAVYALYLLDFHVPLLGRPRSARWLPPC